MTPHENLRELTRIIGNYNPASILDVGCGFGLYGFICRHYFDATFGRYQPKDFQIRIDGIEIYLPYISDIQKLIYSNLYLGDAFEIIDTLNHYDIIICIGVIEHFLKEQGNQLLEKFFQHTDTIIIATPHPDCWEAQGAWFGNKNEKHLSKWLPQDFDRYINTQTIIIPDYIIELAQKKKIGAGIVAYGNTELLNRTIESLKTTTIEYELAVFDNSPIDSDTRAYLENRDDLTLLKSEDFIDKLSDGWSNAGGAFGKNRLIGYFKDKYECILLSDSDVEFLPGCLEKMLSMMASKVDAGYVGCPQANMGFAVHEKGVTEELASICNLTNSRMWAEIGGYPECLMYFSYDSWHSTLANMYGWRTYQLNQDYYIHHPHSSQSNPGVKEQGENDGRKWAEIEAKWEQYWKLRLEKGKGKIYE